MTGLLAIHTATDLCEIAFHATDGVRTARADGRRSHSERLVPLIEEVTSGDLTVVRGIALAAGPGSFTGLRIGLSTAKGLAYGLGVPLYAVSTLAALARDAGKRGDGAVVTAVMRARRNELYAGIYRVAGEHVNPLTDDTVVTDESLSDWIDGHTVPAERGAIVLAGPDAASVASVTAVDGSDLRVVDTRPTAESVLALSTECPDEYIVREPASFEPYYCKEFVARRPRESIFDRLPF